MKKIIYGMFVVLCAMSCANDASGAYRARHRNVSYTPAPFSKQARVSGTLAQRVVQESLQPEEVEPVWIGGNKTVVIFNRDVITPTDFSTINELNLDSRKNYIVIRGKLADDACQDLLNLGARYNGILYISVNNTEVAPQFIATLNELASKLKERLQIEFFSCKDITEDQRAALEAKGASVNIY